MEDKKNVPFIAYESEMTRKEIIIKRLWCVIILLILLFTGTNVLWILKAVV